MEGPALETAQHPVIDIRQVEDWKTPPRISFDRIASLRIAYVILSIFACVYLLCFAMAFAMFWTEKADYDKASELVKFLLQSILPLVTLAVGYYLGDRARQESSPAE
jgi:hypothetical protein